MFRGWLTSPVRSCAVAAAALMALLDCASCGLASGSSQSRAATLPLVSSPPMGLVGLLLVDRASGPPRAAGMDGVIVGYVVSHPALGGSLTVNRGHQHLPVLAFRLHLYVVQANGMGGVEEIRGRGKLEVFCDTDGFGDAFLSDARAIELGQEVEKDDIQFQGRLNTDTYRFYMSLNETAVASRAFTFAGRDRRTPTGRTSRDVLVGEFNDGFLGVAIASTIAMPPLSATEKLIALAGPPPNTPTRY